MTFLLVTGIEGYATFEFDLSTEGKPINIGLIETYPSDVFVKAALHSVRQYRYEVEVVNGQPSISRCQSMKVQFRLG